MKFFVVILIIGLFFTSLKNFTPPANLGISYGQLSKLPKSKTGVSSQTIDLDKKVQPLKFYKRDLEKSKMRVIKTLAGFDSIKIKKVEKNYIYAVDTHTQLKFKDDIEFYFDEEAREIHYRSASRVGFYDFGKNAARYNKFKEKYYNQKKEPFRVW